MSKLIVLFNLKPGTDVARYEAWARATDLPIVRGLPSVRSFDVHRASGTLAGTPSPYQYVEVIDIASVEALRADIGATPAMAEVARQFREFAADPVFVIADAI